MNRFVAKTLLTLSLAFVGLVAAEAPGASQNVQHYANNMSAVVNNTWNTYAKNGFTGDIKAMSRMSSVYLFHQGEQDLLVTFRQVDGGVTITTKNMSPSLLASSQ